jgi:ABC-2 type transport system permease protein
LLLLKEVKQLLGSRSFLAAALITCPLVGYSFIQAVSLFSEASRAALQHSELSSGMNPFEGVLVPTFGSFYLVSTLIFPFLAIRPVSTEVQSGTIKILLQIPLRFSTVMSAKVFAALVVWSVLFLPIAISLIAWASVGGHLSMPETLFLCAGHLLYALTILSLSFLLSSLAKAAATAAILVLGVTLGSWVLDFSLQTETSSVLRSLSLLSLTSILKPFEQGLVSLPVIIRSLALILFALFLSLRFIKPGVSVSAKGLSAVASFTALLLIFFVSHFVRSHWDVSESQRNSLSVTYQEQFKKMEGKLSIRVFLSPDDPRYRDLERQLFSKFRRLMPHVEIVLVNTGKTQLFGTGSSDNYGLNEYEYKGKVAKSHSTSPREILPLLQELIGVQVTEYQAPSYRGYPAVIETNLWGIFYYLLLPVFFVLVWWMGYRKPKEK